MEIPDIITWLCAHAGKDLVLGVDGKLTESPHMLYPVQWKHAIDQDKFALRLVQMESIEGYGNFCIYATGAKSGNESEWEALGVSPLGYAGEEFRGNIVFQFSE